MSNISSLAAKVDALAIRLHKSRPTGVRRRSDDAAATAPQLPRTWSMSETPATPPMSPLLTEATEVNTTSTPARRVLQRLAESVRSGLITTLAGRRKRTTFGQVAAAVASRAAAQGLVPQSQPSTTATEVRNATSPVELRSRDAGDGFEHALELAIREQQQRDNANSNSEEEKKKKELDDVKLGFYE